jgi:Ca-activated chloride channel family protein
MWWKRYWTVLMIAALPVATLPQEAAPRRVSSPQRSLALPASFRAQLPRLQEAGANSAQTDQAPGPALPELVEVHVSVLDKDGRPVVDLTKDDFRVLEGKQEQEIIRVSRGPSVPLSVALLIDTSGSRSDRIPDKEPSLALQLLQTVLSDGGEALVGSFGRSMEVWSDFTKDIGALEGALRQVYARPPYGPGVLYDSICWICDTKLSARRGPRALVVLSDCDPSSNEDRRQVLEATARTRTTVSFVCSIPPSRPGEPFRRWAPEGIARKATHQIAETTGGVAIVATRAREEEKAFGQIADLLRGRYTVVYRCQTPMPEGKSRQVKVETTRKGLRVVASRGFYMSTN